MSKNENTAGSGETKIVRVTPKAKDTEKKEEVRVTKKANIRPPVRPAKAQAQTEKGSEKAPDKAPDKAQDKTSDKASERTPDKTAEGGGNAPKRDATAAKKAAVSGGGPARIAGGAMPQRISRKAIEAEEKAEEEAVLAAAAAEEAKKAAAEKAAAEKAAAAKIAAEKAAAEKAAAEAAAAAAENAKNAENAEEDKTAEEKPDATKDAAKEAAKDAADKPAPDTAAPTSPRTPKKTDTTKQPQRSRGQGQGDRSAQRQSNRPAQKPGDRPGDRQAAPKAPKADGAGKDKSAPGKEGTKAKDKKHSKGKEQKGDTDRIKKPSIRGQKRAPVDDFRGSKKSPILEDNSLEKRPVRSKNRPKPQPKPQEVNVIPEDLLPGTIVINVPITVAGYAEQTEKSLTEVIMALMSLGIMANANQNLDETTVQLLSDELELYIYIGSDAGEIVEEGLEDFEDDPADLVSRPPIITVMGHVDHGKTSLLDAIRESNVTEGEAGGITQHIGASEVTTGGKRIVFLDTPGHEAFTAMRARGAHVTDIAVLVVAADDGVMPQTIESISHAKAAGVPVIVAINKMDKEGANPDRVKKELSDHGILVEDWGGDVISVEVSAKSREGIRDLLEMILLQADVLELKANPNRLALGTVIEARLDKSRGPVATLLVLNGTLESGMSVVAGTTSGRIRVMTDFRGKSIKTAGPATAVEITGLSDVPMAGDEFNAVRDDKVAREIAENRRMKKREEIMAHTSGASLENLFERIGASEMKELNIIVKGDVQGSVGALVSSLEKLNSDEVKIRIVHTGVGTVNESDVMLANTSEAIIIGFNVRPSSAVTALADSEGVEIRTYRVIYDAIGEVEAAMKGMLDPEYKEVILGKLEIRETFKVPGSGMVGGAYVTEGKVLRNAEVRIVRDGIVVHEGKIGSLRRFKDDVKEVAAGYECGIGFENYNDIKDGDIVEAFVMEEIERT
ncbi:MAG: translation initiation factor IF-2 [Clostridiales Family XIII bacterium]|jgi:translation initiation factor IF-2|nr:translation initiation factor IF-2 [Clostridiales Family XIII bacterium]